VKKLIFEREFAKSIESSEPIEIDTKNIEVPASYDGPALKEDEPVTEEWCVKLMDYLKD